MAGKNTVELTGKNYDETLKNNDLVLVDFWAPWCGPCRMQGPILEEVGEAVDGTVLIGKVNVDDAPELAGRYGVRSIPTLILLKAGEMVKQWVGVQQSGTLLSEIAKHKS